MKAYLVTTGLLFGLITVMHVWRVVAEWHPPVDPLFMLGMAVLIALPAALSWWAFRLLRNLRENERPRKKDSDHPAV